MATKAIESVLTGTVTHVLAAEGTAGDSAVGPVPIADARGRVSVKDFGVIGDDSTDDTDALLAALESERPVFIPDDCICRIDEALTPSSLVGLYGPGTIKQMTAGADVITLSGVNGWEISGVRFVHGSASPTGTGSTEAGIRVTNCDKWNIESCRFSGFRGSEVLVYSAEEFSILDNKFTNNFELEADEDINAIGNSIFLYANGSAAEIRNGLVQGNRITGGSGIGIALQTTTATSRIENISILDNTILNCRNYGIMVYTVALSGTTQAVIDKILCQGNTIRNVLGDLENSATSSRTHGAGIYLLGDVRAVVNGNIISKTAQGTENTDTLAPAGIGVNGIRSLVAVGNEIQAARYYAIDVNTSAITDDILFDSTRINGAGEASSRGIRFRWSVDRDAKISFTNFEIRDAASWGIFGSKSASGKVANLVIKNGRIVGLADKSTNSGIQVEGVARLVLEDVSIKNFANRGLRLQGVVDTAYVNRCKVDNTTASNYDYSHTGVVYHTRNEGSAPVVASTASIGYTNGLHQKITAAAAINLADEYVSIAGGTGYAITLAAPDRPGVKKIIEMISITSGAVTLALTNVVGGSAGTTASFDAVGEILTLVSSSTKWIVIDELGVTLS